MRASLVKRTIENSLKFIVGSYDSAVEKGVVAMDLPGLSKPFWKKNVKTLMNSQYALVLQVEFCENEGCSMLAVSIAWDTALHRSFSGAVKSVSDTLTQVIIYLTWPLAKSFSVKLCLDYCYEVDCISHQASFWFITCIITDAYAGFVST